MNASVGQPGGRPAPLLALPFGLLAGLKASVAARAVNGGLVLDMPEYKAEAEKALKQSDDCKIAEQYSSNICLDISKFQCVNDRSQSHSKSMSRPRGVTLELRCVSGHLALSLAKAGFRSLASDLKREVLAPEVLDIKVVFAICDLLSKGTVADIIHKIRGGRFLYIHIGVVCSSFSILRIRSKTSSRTKATPWGDEVFAGEAEGNCHLRKCLLILAACNDVNIF